VLDEWVNESSYQDVQHYVPSCGIPSNGNMARMMNIQISLCFI